MLRGAAFHYIRLLGNGHRALREVAAALASEPTDRVLDFGCGAGGFCRAARGDYVGIDLDPAYIAFARWRWHSPRRRFEMVRLDALPAGETFDKAMVNNCLHHLSDSEATALLARLARIVRQRLVILEIDPTRSNWFQSWLIAHDRGAYVRPPDQVRALLSERFAVVEERVFRNTPRTAVQILFVCEPKGAGRPAGHPAAAPGEPSSR